MNTQHTPGPWFVRQRKHVIEIDNGLESPDYRHITNALPWADGGPTDEYGVSLQVLADAHLIAAAPSLLKALKAFLNKDASVSHMIVTYENARIAIAEAEGELRK